MYQDVTTSYLGLDLRSPVLVGACPLTLKPELVRELAIAGAGAVVLPSLMEEQIQPSTNKALHDSVASEASETEPDSAISDRYNGGTDAYLEAIPLLKRHSGLPIIASLNGCHDGDWLAVAQALESSGADAIELSINAGSGSSDSTSEEVECVLVGAIQRVTNQINIPISVKLLPFFTSLPNLVQRLKDAGAKGVVLFGREPVWEIMDGDLVPTSRWQLTSSGLLQTTLSGLMRVRSVGSDFSIAASGGLSTAVDVIQAVTAGADVAMVTSEIYRTGPDAVAHLVEGLSAYLQRHQLGSYSHFVNRCREHVGERGRAAQISSMLLPPTERPTTDTSIQHGDRWGHPTKSC